ncbi:hypothetical protein C7M84_013628 [Penaeus vannamei]|uniref:Uncharacterized protein n=1 Tax=Penaeus vannamei TaxID=6689 RepID=A0A3R7PEF1_PENVA|nr:hypothetical protein C7M84_013628 [Penaeus vannamei]
MPNTSPPQKKMNYRHRSAAATHAEPTASPSETPPAGPWIEAAFKHSLRFAFRKCFLLIGVAAICMMACFRSAWSAPLGLLTSHNGDLAPYLTSSSLNVPHRQYLHLDHLAEEESKPKPRGVRPVLLGRPLPAVDPRLPARAHPYSLLYLHFVPVEQLQ